MSLPGYERAFEAIQSFHTESVVVPSSKIDLKVLEADLPDGDFTISSKAVERAESWGMPASVLEQVASIAEGYHYHRPDLHAKELFSEPTILQKQGDKPVLITLPRSLIYETQLDYGECAELAERARIRLHQDKGLMNRLFGPSGVMPAVVGGRSARFYVHELSKHSWMALLPFDLGGALQLGQSINVDPCFRRIETYEESGYVHRDYGFEQGIAIFAPRTELLVSSETLSVSQFGEMGDSFRISYFRTPMNRSRITLGIDRTHSVVFAIGLAFSPQRKQPLWFLDMMDEDGRKLSQVVLATKQQTQTKSKVIGLKFNVLAPDFNPAKLDPVITAQIFSCLQSATDSLVG